MADLGNAIDNMELTLEEIDGNAGLDDAEEREEERPTSKVMLHYEMQSDAMKMVARSSDLSPATREESMKSTEGAHQYKNQGKWKELRIGSSDLSDDEESDEQAWLHPRVVAARSAAHSSLARVSVPSPESLNRIESVVVDETNNSDDEESAEQACRVPSLESLIHSESAVVDETNSEKRHQGTVGESEVDIGAPPISAVEEPVRGVLHPQASAASQIKTHLESECFLQHKQFRGGSFLTVLYAPIKDWEEPINVSSAVLPDSP